MRAFQLLSLLIAGAAAQTTACAAENILQACLSTYNAQLDSCQPNDWSCMCNQVVNVLTCYNNCPNDSGKPSVQNQQIQYCAAASQASSLSAATATSSSTSTTSTTDLSVTQASQSSTSVSTTPTHTNAAAALVTGGPGLFAAALGAVALL